MDPEVNVGAEERMTMNGRKYVVGLVQMRMGEDPEANFASAVKHIREAARLGANIVCLPELFRAQYFQGPRRPNWRR